jgi:hypothetical protein
MGLQPLDLQTMYTQLDKISKNAVAEQQGAQLARAMRQDETQKQEFLRSETVKELQTDKEAVSAVDDRGGRNSREQQKRKHKKPDDSTGEEPESATRTVFTESYLGQHIDVSG